MGKIIPYLETSCKEKPLQVLSTLKRLRNSALEISFKGGGYLPMFFGGYAKIPLFAA
jgi:hypothetical protein